MLEQMWRNMPPVVKNLLLINLMMFAATIIFEMQGKDLNSMLGLYNFMSSEFEPYQIVTHMFMHGNFIHIFFNMFALISFGMVLERVWGPKRFLIFYLITGFGSMLLYSGVKYYEYTELMAMLPENIINEVRNDGLDLLHSGRNWYGDQGELNANLFIPMVGASGAIYGLLVAFGLLFPNTEMMMLLLPIPIKAKYFVPILILFAYYAGMNPAEGDNTAHFAHLGGALFGFILVKLWSTNRNKFY